MSAPPEPRTVVLKIGGMDEVFTSFEALEKRSREIEYAIREIERTRLTANPRDGPAWAVVAAHASTLRQLLAAMQDWIDAEDVEIERARALIRDLGIDAHE